MQGKDLRNTAKQSKRVCLSGIFLNSTKANSWFLNSVLRIWSGPSWDFAGLRIGSYPEGRLLVGVPACLAHFLAYGRVIGKLHRSCGDFRLDLVLAFKTRQTFVLKKKRAGKHNRTVISLSFCSNKKWIKKNH